MNLPNYQTHTVYNQMDWQQERPITYKQEIKLLGNLTGWVSEILILL